MKHERLYVDIHVLQTVPPSCVNRDDTGSPKTAVYGGVTRARVSSQAWKKSVRDFFKQEQVFSAESLGMRTKHLANWIHEEMQKHQADLSIDLATKLLKALKIKMEKDKKTDEYQTKALFFMSMAQAKSLANVIIENAQIIDLVGLLTEEDAYDEEETSEVKKVIRKKTDKQYTGDQKRQFDKVVEQAQLELKENPSIDIALFGRMVADDPSLNTDACAQVAHAISTHRVSNEYDYFTAVDDLAPKDNAGAAHIGTVEFNSSTLYRYATVAVHALKDQLGDDTAEAVAGFVRAFVTSMPGGKQNTFANRTLPDAVMVTLRPDQPLNLAGAFEKPILAGEDGYVERSVKALAAQAKRLYREFAGAPAKAFVIGEGLKELGDELPFDQLLLSLKAEIAGLGVS